MTCPPLVWSANCTGSDVWSSRDEGEGPSGKDYLRIARNIDPAENRIARKILIGDAIIRSWKSPPFRQTSGTITSESNESDLDIIETKRERENILYSIILSDYIIFSHFPFDKREPRENFGDKRATTTPYDNRHDCKDSQMQFAVCSKSLAKCRDKNLRNESFEDFSKIKAARTRRDSDAEIF